MNLTYKRALILPFALISFTFLDLVMVVNLCIFSVAEHVEAGGVQRAQGVPDVVM